MRKTQYGNKGILEDSHEKNYYFRQYLDNSLRDEKITKKEHDEWQYTFHDNPESAALPMTEEDIAYLEQIKANFIPV